MFTPLRSAASSKSSLVRTSKNTVLPSAKLKATLWLMSWYSRSQMVEIEHCIDRVVQQQHVLARDLPGGASGAQLVRDVTKEVLANTTPRVESGPVGLYLKFAAFALRDAYVGDLMQRARQRRRCRRLARAQAEHAIIETRAVRVVDE